MDRNILFTSLILFLVLQSCSPVLEQDITQLEKIEMEPLKLVPGVDHYSIRLDIIRETEMNGGNSMDGGSSSLADYTRMGFHLGNGLFYDLNDNLCLLVDKLYGIEENENFEIIENVSPTRKNRYVKEGNLFEERYGSFLSSTQRTRFERDEEDGSLIIKESILNKMRLYETDNELILKYPLSKTVISFDGKGYVLKQLFGKRNYVQIGNGVNLDGRYFINQRGNRIEIFRNKSFSTKRILLFTIIRGENQILIYDKKNRGYKLDLEGNRMEYRRNKTMQVFYDRIR